MEAYRSVAEAVTPFEPPVLDVPAVVALEQAIAAAGTPLDTLMRRAGRFLAFEARKMLEGEGPIVIFCGNGNNGGDGWVAAEYLDRWGVPVRVVTARAPEDLTAEPARSAALRAQAALGDRSAVLVAPDAGEIAGLLEASPLAIDAILGTGFSHDAVKTPFDGWIRTVNDARNGGTVVVAADVPSGLSAQTGAAADTVRADVTVTMIVPKPGLLAPEGAPWCGRVRVAPLAYIEPLLEAESLAS